MNLKDNKGAALLTTLMIGILALVVILALFTFILFGKGSSVLKERYTTTLEAAKGTAYYIIEKLNKGAMDLYCYNPSDPSKKCKCGEVYPNPSNSTVLQCDYGNTTLTNTTVIDLGTYSTLPAPDGNTYNINATLFYKDVSPDGRFDIYSVEVKAVNSGTKETATIDFIYKAPKLSYWW